MNRAAQNALLKVLEEPPPYCIIILVTPKPGLLTATVRSRCRKIAFAPLDSDAVTRILVGLGTAPDEAAVASGMAGGSAKAALDLCADGFMRARTQGLGFLTDPGRNGVTGILAVAADFASDPGKARIFLDTARSWALDVCRRQLGITEVRNRDFLDEIDRTAQNQEDRTLIHIYEEVARTAELLDSEINANRTVLFEVLCLRIARALSGPDFGCARRSG
jgi:DNA polymerase-3 subunit delta'